MPFSFQRAPVAGGGGGGAVTGTAPISAAGGVVSISPASGSLAGSMSIGDFVKLGAATALNTASTIVQRDAGGNFSAGTITATVSNASNLNSQLPSFYLARANQTGTQTSTTISDFDTQVRLNRLDQLAAPTSAVGFGNQRITAIATPTNGTDAVTKDYADALIATGNNKGTARAASTGDVNLASPGSVMDGVTLSAANLDIVLLNAQTIGSQNGPYIFNGPTTPLTRATNADIAAEVRSGLFIFVSEGAANGSNGFTLTTPNPIVLGTTSLNFTQTSGAGQIIAGLGITKAGNILNAGAGFGILVNPDDIAIDTSIVARKYPPQLIGDGTSTVITVTHGLGNPTPVWSKSQVASPFIGVTPPVAFPTANTATFTFSVAPTTNQYRVTLIG